MNNLDTIEASRLDDENRRLAFTIFRFTLGVNFFVHGGIRLVTGLETFVDNMKGGFSESPLPSVLVVGFLYVLPFVEVALGLLLILGAWTRRALPAGGLLMAGLMFGAGSKQDRGAVGWQMVYAIAFFLLLSHARHDGLGLDWWRRQRDVRG